MRKSHDNVLRDNIQGDTAQRDIDKPIKASLLVLAILYASTTYVSADEVIGRAPDNTVGATLGGWTGFLVGGAGAGPFGAILGGLGGAVVGTWAGINIQQSTNTSGTAYVVKAADNTEQVVRSPNKAWHAGEQVVISGNRLHAAN